MGPIEFNEGHRFRNRFGEYVVKQRLPGEKFLAKYLSGDKTGETQVLTESVQRQIIENRLPVPAVPWRPKVSAMLRRQAKERVRSNKYALDSELVQTMGFLAVRGMLSAAVPTTYEKDFRERYQETAVTHLPQVHEGLYIEDVSDDPDRKWYVSLHLRFTVSADELRSLYFADVQPVVDTATEGAHYVNSNALLWLFIEYGFVLGRRQFSDRIVKRLPSKYHQAFTEGVALAG